MKIEKITENKIRIILNYEEIEKNNLNLISITQNCESTKKLFKKILKQAEKEVGFQLDDSKLLIEAFVSTDGFFVITFTKLSETHNSPIGKSVKLKIKNNNSILKRIYIYKFDNFDEFCHFCTYINNYNLDYLNTIIKHSSLYEYKSKYFLVLSNNINLYNFNIIITEFANLISKSHSFESKLLEFGKVIFKNNAINNGIRFFCK